ncbi:MAG: P1 family peptidase [Conexibacter sp.]
MPSSHESSRTTPRELGIPLGNFSPAPLNGITDVAGVRVGEVTIVAPAGAAHGAIRTGVTCIWPHESWPWEQAVYAGATVLNGHGELIGICQLQEWGLLRSPIMLTSSLSIGAVYDAVARWSAEQDPALSRRNFFMPVVTEVSDLALSDNRAFPITFAHVAEALESAHAGRPLEGGVGAGTGTVCYDLKGGIGTSSRVVPHDGGAWTLGALVLTNYGERRNLTLAGVPVGAQLDLPIPPSMPTEGSAIVVLATDAPLGPHQLSRLATRGAVGLTRSGAFVGQTSGEIAIAFSTANRVAVEPAPALDVELVADGFNPVFNALFEASMEAVHEAVLNSLFAAETTTGFLDVVVPALPVEQTARMLRERGAIA